METKDKLAAIREACVAANPEIDKTVTPCSKCETNGTFPIGSDTPCPDCANGWIGGRPIRLADVLLAIEKESSHPALMEYWTGVDGFFRIKDSEMNTAGWNLRNDSLDWHAEHQPETIDFLYDVLKQE